MLVDRRTEPAALGPTAPEVEPNDDARRAQVLESGARVAAAIGSATDVDCYRLRGPAVPGDLGAAGADGGGPPVVLGFVAAGPADHALVLELLDARGRASVARSAGAGERATLSYLRIDPAGAVIRVRAPVPKGAPPIAAPVAYALEYAARALGADEEPVPELEPDDQPATAIALPPRGALTGRLDGPDDRDVVALPPLEGGATYRVELAAIPELAMELRLRAGGATLATARGGKGGELRLRNLPGAADAPLVLVLRAVDGTSATPYTLRVATEPPLASGVEREPNDDRAHASRLAAGDAVAGYLWPGDVDWYCADAPIGARVDGLADVDWRLELTDADGNTLAKADAGRRGAGEELAPDPRARCVRVSGRPRDTAYDEPYRLTLLPAR